MRLNLGHKKIVSDLEGPGKRYAYWLQGCSIRCIGCCNPHLFKFDSKNSVLVAELVKELEKEPTVEGISLLGGERLDQVDGVLEFVTQVRHLGLSVMLFSGYTLEQIQSDPRKNKCLEFVDVLVAGPYQQENRDLSRRWIGSTNQKLFFLSSFYQPTDSRFYQSNEIELKLSGKLIEVTGFPMFKYGDLKQI